MSRTRIVRGRQTQRLVAEWFVSHGWPHALSRGSSEAGEDILHMPKVSVEVKGTRDMPLLLAIRQSERNSNGKVPVVVWRPDGFGPEKIGQWVAAMSLETLTGLLALAGLTDDRGTDDTA